jgi:hypothetical protein
MPNRKIRTVTHVQLQQDAKNCDNVLLLSATAIGSSLVADPDDFVTLLGRRLIVAFSCFRFERRAPAQLLSRRTISANQNHQ